MRFEDLIGQVACRFTRVEPLRQVRALLEGLLAELPRKNCWILAEYAGDATPHGSSSCCRGPAGTLTRSVTICAST